MENYIVIFLHKISGFEKLIKLRHNKFALLKLGETSLRKNAKDDLTYHVHMCDIANPTIPCIGQVGRMDLV